MPRQARNILTATKVRNLIRTGKPVAVSDGAGLTLTISQTGHASWVLRYRIGGKRKEVTIGPEADYPLAEARETAETLRRRVAASEDVGATKQHQRASDAAGEHPETFAELAKVWFERTQAERLKHPDVVWRVFRNWINPRLGGMALTDIRGFHIVECLEAIKDGGAPTVMNDARRYIRSVFAYG
ncbi:MAG: Arm DNA-binding domain-containing protein, partial [Gammaproteobacteria bacterium]|nr:Arm DNA-binding domain-containing protein [Gammaproteobacteria bacterium]